MRCKGKDWIQLAQEHVNMGSIKHSIFFDQMNDYQLHKKDCSMELVSQSVNLMPTLSNLALSVTLVSEEHPCERWQTDQKVEYRA
jgi:hypothetical protein